jgi:hypothetical protein
MTSAIETTVGRFLVVTLIMAGAAACAPRVAIEAPKEPITINLNIKLDAELRVKLEETAKKDIAKNPGIF